MVSNYGAYSTEEQMSFFGLSTDTKPIEVYKNTAIPNASTFCEMDTGKVFLYDAENKRWLE